MRTQLTFYTQVNEPSHATLEILGGDWVDGQSSSGGAAAGVAATVGDGVPHSPFPPASTVIKFWLVGLMAWYFVFGRSGGVTDDKEKGTNKASGKQRRKKTGSVKNV